MKGIQTIFMILLTLAVGALFLIRTPSDQERQLNAAQTVIAQQGATISFWENQPTEIPASPAPQITNTPEVLTANPIAPANPSTGGAAPAVAPTFAAFPTPLPTSDPAASAIGPRVVSVQASTQVDANGCALNPATTFGFNDVIYGVVSLAETQVGDTLLVQFTYETGGQTVYEDQFVISEGGDFCRWYTIEPSSTGWAAGSYSIRYQLNTNPPVELDYNIAGGGGATGADTTGDTMADG
jgi:hypothetical protein